MLGFNAIGLNAVGMSGAPATQTGPVVALVGSACSQSNASSTGAATITQGSHTVNLVGAPSVQTAQSGAGAASVIPQSSQPSSVTVPAARTAKFTGRSRLVVFTGSKPVVIQKGALDELYLVGDFSKDLLESSTTALSVSSVSVGVTVLESAALQSGLGVVKLGALDLTSGAKNLFTFRVTLANGEQVDRTIDLKALDDAPKVFGKDPDDKRFYTFDFSADATFGGSALASVSVPVVVGVTALSLAVVQGNTATLKIGGLDTGEGAVNSCTLTAFLANGEKLVRTIYFTQEEH